MTNPDYNQMLTPGKLYKAKRKFFNKNCQICIENGDILLITKIVENSNNGADVFFLYKEKLTVQFFDPGSEDNLYNWIRWFIEELT